MYNHNSITTGRLQLIFVLEQSNVVSQKQQLLRVFALEVVVVASVRIDLASSAEQLLTVDARRRRKILPGRQFNSRKLAAILVAISVCRACNSRLIEVTVKFVFVRAVC